MSQVWARDPYQPQTWPRLFTLPEANSLLPDVMPLLLELRSYKVTLDSAVAALSALTPAMRQNGHAAQARELEARIQEVTEELAAGIDQVTAMGIDIKSLEHGLIDFPSLREGRVVFLCWRLGEGPTIRFWHDIDAGFAGRRPLTD
ncbi:MAG: DUF2203 domain-containing protein [Thermomicrobiales bacterium]